MTITTIKKKNLLHIGSRSAAELCFYADSDFLPSTAKAGSMRRLCEFRSFPSLSHLRMFHFCQDKMREANLLSQTNRNCMSST